MDLSRFESIDPILLMSMVNMKLRDEFSGDLDELSRYFDIDKQALINKLAKAGFDFSEQSGQFN